MSKVQVQTHVFGKRFSETVLHELDPRYSRETVTIAGGSGPIPFGSVLMRDVNGKYTPLTEEEGVLGDAKAVYIGEPLPASETDQLALVLRGYCIVNGTNLVFDASVTQKSAALDALRDMGFIVKEVESDANA